VRGDRLSVIAQQAYGDASLYRMIQRANPSVRNADLIYSDQVITLPPEP
jgi:nucleoid-associated protein YgaU